MSQNTMLDMFYKALIMSKTSASENSRTQKCGQGEKTWLPLFKDTRTVQWSSVVYITVTNDKYNFDLRRPKTQNKGEKVDKQIGVHQ